MGRVAVVTGGTRGIGAAVSKALKAAGYHGRRELSRQRRGRGQSSRPRPAFASTNGTSPTTTPCAEGWRRSRPRLGPVDVLVNNAGITRTAMFHKMTPDQWYAVINTNLNSLFNMTRPVIEGMRERKFGRIINISSINGQKGQMGQVNYSAAKAGDIGFTKALAQESANKGDHRQRDLPGLHRHRDGAGGAEGGAGEAIVPQIPVGRLGEPEEIARCVVFLASDDAGFITGSTLSANGGQVMT